MNLWSKIDLTGGYPPPCFGCTACSISKSKIILFGGAVGEEGKYSMSGNVYLFNVFKNEWNKLERILVIS